jgi:cellobiose-specific phosphotransferase system component IIA
VAQAAAAGIIATAGGAASFTTRALTYAADNGKTLQITGITITSATPNCSAAFTQNVTLGVNPNPTLTGATQSAVCSGSTATINLTGLIGSSTSTISYTIDGVAQPAATGVVATAGGAASFTTRALTYAADNGKTLQITGITITSATPNCSAAFTRNVTLSVNPNPTLTGATQSVVCSGSAATINLTGLVGSSTSTINYKIDGVAQTAATGIIATAGGAASFTTRALSYAADNGKTLQITGITITSSTPNCSASFTQNVTLNVEQAISGGVIGSGQSKCDPANPDAFTEITPASGGIGPYNYQWRSSTVSGGPYSDIIGANSATYDAPAGLAVTTYYIRKVTSAGVCGSAISNEISVVVNPSKVTDITSLSGLTSVCKGSTLTLTALPVANATSYVWDFSWTVAGVDATTATNVINIDLSTTGPGVVASGAGQ